MSETNTNAATTLPEGWQHLSGTDKIALGMAIEGGQPVPEALKAKITAANAKAAAETAAAGRAPAGQVGPARGMIDTMLAMNAPRAKSAVELIAEGLKNEGGGRRGTPYPPRG
jgi:predicted RNA-binding Zn ribbon-like protein